MGVFENKFWWFFLYVSIFFNSLVLFKSPFEFHIGYLIWIFLIPNLISKHSVTSAARIILLILFLIGNFDILVGNNTWGYFYKVYLGLLISYLFYGYVIQETEFKIDRLFKGFLFGSYIVVLIGLGQYISYKVGFKYGYNFKWILNKWGYVEEGGLRINSIFGEPSHFGEIISVAALISLHDIFASKPYYFKKHQAVIILGVFYLSNSTTGYFAVFVGLILFLINYGFIRYALLFIPFSYFLFNILYNNVPSFRDRYDSQTKVYRTGKFQIGKDHGSTIIQYNNYHVSIENMKIHPLFGTGIGSHPVAFEKFSLTKDVKVGGFQLNNLDANSMLYRLMSETGLFGLIVFFTIIIRFFVKKGTEVNERYEFSWLISSAIIAMVAAKLLRQGHYFLNGFPFFIWLYYYNYKLAKGEIEVEHEPELIEE